MVLEVRGDDGRAIVVVAGVQDQADRVPDPLSRLDGAKFVEDENVGFEDRAENIQFGSLDGCIVGVLDLFQHFAIVVEQAGNAAIQQLLEDSDGQVGLAGSDLANNQQAFVAARIALLGKVGRGEVSLGQRRVSAGEIGIKVRQLAMFVAARDAGRCQQRLCPRPQLAVAASDRALSPAAAVLGSGLCVLPSGAAAQKANFRGSLDRVLDQFRPFTLQQSFSSDFAPGKNFAQAGTRRFLCTTCEAAAQPVDSLGKLFPSVEKPPC